jgi:hypothetical protein
LLLHVHHSVSVLKVEDLLASRQGFDRNLHCACLLVCCARRNLLWRLSLAAGRQTPDLFRGNKAYSTGRDSRIGTYA